MGIDMGIDTSTHRHAHVSLTSLSRMSEIDAATREKLAAWSASLPTRKPPSASNASVAQVNALLQSLSDASSESERDEQLRRLVALPGVNQLLLASHANLADTLIRHTRALVRLLQTDDGSREHRVVCQQVIALMCAAPSSSSSGAQSGVKHELLLHVCALDTLELLFLKPLAGQRAPPTVLAVLAKLHNSLWDLCPSEMAAFLCARPAFIGALLDQLALSSAFDMLGKIVRSGIYEPSSGVLGFLQSSGVAAAPAVAQLEPPLFAQLFDRLHPRHDSRLHEGVLYAVQELAAAALAQDADSLRFSGALRCWLAATLLSDASLDRLFSMALSKGTTPAILSSRLACLRTVHALLRLRRSPQDQLLDATAPPASSGDGGVTFPVQQATLRRFAGWRAMTADVQKQSTTGPPVRGLPSYRYDLFQFLAALAELNDAAMFDAFAQHGMTSLLIETFLSTAAQHNYFVAGCVQRVLAAILFEARAEKACTDALERCRLLSRLVLADQAHKQTPAPRTRPGAARCLRSDGRHAEHGAFLASLFQLIADAAKVNPVVQAAVKSNATFAAYAVLAGHHDRTPLGGARPTLGSSNFASPFAAYRANVFWDRSSSSVNGGAAPALDEAALAARWAANEARKLSIGTIKSVPNVADVDTSSQQASPRPSAEASASAALLLPLAALLVRSADAQDDPCLPLDARLDDSLRTVLAPLAQREHVELAKSLCRQFAAENEGASMSLSALAQFAATKRLSSQPATLPTELLECCAIDGGRGDAITRANVQFALRVCGLPPAKRAALSNLFDELAGAGAAVLTRSQFVDGAVRMLALLTGADDGATASKRRERRDSSKDKDKDKERERARRKAEKLERERLALAREQEEVEAELARLNEERTAILKDVSEWATSDQSSKSGKAKKKSSSARKDK
jgi:hypothetical protein